MIQLDSTEARKFAVHLEGYEGLGGELVKNGDFSEIGADVVENGAFNELGTDVITDGNFTATGSDLITNGDFSATGSELVVNGDFLSATSWNVNSNWNINTALGVAEADGTSDADINQSVWLPVIGKSYKVTFEVVTWSQGEVLFRLGGVVGTSRVAPGIYTEYIVATTDDRLRVDSTNLFIGSVKDVSVKELGEDWTVGDKWSLSDEGARLVSSTSAASGLSQSDVFEIGKSYKVTLDAVVNSGKAKLEKSGGAIQFQIDETKTYVEYFEATKTTFYLNRVSTISDIYINNIIVQELGEDWTQGNGWTIGDSKAISAQGLGGELITNGDFSDTGAELITNGDFATSGTPTTTSWSLGWAQTGGSEDGSNITGGELVLTLPDGEDSNYNRVYATNGTSAITGVVEVGKSYKLTYTVTAVTGSPTFKYINGGAYADAPTSLETHVIYYVCTVTAHFGLRNSGNDSSITLDNVSIKELGEDWTVGTGWSIGEDKLIGSGSQSGYTSQANIFTPDVNKSYKLTLEVEDYTSGDFRILTNGTTYQSDAISGDGLKELYFDSGAPTSGIMLISWSGLFYGSITNISVEEIATSYLTQAGVLTADKTWKVIYAAVVSAGTVSATEWGAVTSATATVTDYVQVGTTTDFRMVNIDGYFEGSVTGISAQLVDPLGYWTLQNGWSIGNGEAIYDGLPVSQMHISQVLTVPADKWFKISLEVLQNEGIGANTVFFGAVIVSAVHLDVGTYVWYGLSDNVTPTQETLYIYGRPSEVFKITDVSVQELDPNEYWSLGTGWSIGDLKALYDGSAAGYSWIDQNIGATLGKTYRVDFNAVVTSGSFQVKMGSVDADASDENTIVSGTNTYSILLVSGGSSGAGIYGAANAGNFVGSITDIAIRLKNTGAVRLTLINQLTEKETIVDLTPLASNGRYTEFSYQPTDLIEGMYMIKFTGDSVTYANTLAYITTGTPPLGESEYTEYTTGDDNPDHVYIP